MAEELDGTGADNTSPDNVTNLDELTKLIVELKGEIANLTVKVESMAPVEGAGEEETPAEEAPPEETPADESPDEEEKEPSEDEVEAIDKLLQSE